MQAVARPANDDRVRGPDEGGFLAPDEGCSVGGTEDVAFPVSQVIEDDARDRHAKKAAATGKERPDGYCTKKRECRV